MPKYARSTADVPPRGVCLTNILFKPDYRELNASDCNGQKNIPTMYDYLELK